MGIYIKGMGMPKNCWECKFEKISSNHNEGPYCVCIITEKHIDDGQESWCPLIPVPPHGDLIDRETIVDSVCDGVCSCSECSFNGYPFDSCVLQTNLEKLKAVLPAEKAQINLGDGHEAD